MARAAILVLPLLLGSCVNAKQCLMPAAWKPCSGQSAEAGASGTPPSIATLTSPGCNYVDEPTIAADIAVTDAEGDATLLRVTVSQGVRLSEVDIPLAQSGTRDGSGWDDHFEFTLGSASGNQQSTFQARVKVTDAAGNQSVPWCKDVTLLQE